ncbi:hypothetical protein H4R18_005023 [Coemansia javaensis]|uniref:Uncharacterized protein n=1 Tax=Coemansia javaensis TaxID=2761396 RepID=A0A9W8LG18_9FUNG|nr:hypothetical protein H4R18_005023 [Coemansia javaensis]
MRFPSTKHLTISVHLTAEDYIAALDAASHIFENAQDGDDLKLDIMSSPLPIPPEIISTRLTKLEISPTTSADTMLGLIRGLPNLTNLKLWKLWYDDVQADISVPEPTVDCLVTPFNTRIKAPKRPIVEFVEAYSVWYPHLSGIVLKLDERDDVLPPAPINIAALQSLLLG